MILEFLFLYKRAANFAVCSYKQQHIFPIMIADSVPDNSVVSAAL